MNKENISINIDDSNVGDVGDEDDNNSNNNLESILKEIDDYEYEYSPDYNFNRDTILMAKTIDYDTNYNVKQLLTICDYYGLLKEIKINKLKKQEIISFLLDFEENIENSLIVYKRKQLWYFIEELKNDKFMKKFILWQ
jgi:hypothetical protein